MLSPSVLKRLYPRAPQAHLDTFLARHEALFDEYGIGATRNRLHFFLAQIGHESGGLTITEENLNYSAPRLMAVWPSRFRTLGAAEPFARNPQKLGNNVYANRMGNGDTASGDGFRYRGRGYAQITGRDGYREVGDLARLNLETAPEKAAQADHALRSACAFWAWKKLSPVADRGDFVELTRRWNGGTIGMDERRQWLVRVQNVVPARMGAPPEEAPRLDRATIMHVQAVLREADLYHGAIDGIIGRLSRAALRAWQAQHGLRVAGEITAETLASMPPRPEAGESAPTRSARPRRHEGNGVRPSA